MSVNKNGTNTVGGRIKNLRCMAKMSQEELAERLHIENRASISSYETNRRAVSGELVVDISKIFGVSTDYILTGENYEDLYMDEVIRIFHSIKSSYIKEMVIDQIKAAKKLDTKIKCC